jgi:hypothetical protein
MEVVIYEAMNAVAPVSVRQGCKSKCRGKGNLIYLRFELLTYITFIFSYRRFGHVEATTYPAHN